MKSPWHKFCVLHEALTHSILSLRQTRDSTPRCLFSISGVSDDINFNCCISHLRSRNSGVLAASICWSVVCPVVSLLPFGTRHLSFVTLSDFLSSDHCRSPFLKQYNCSFLFFSPSVHQRIARRSTQSLQQKLFIMHCQALILLAVCSNMIKAGPIRHYGVFPA